MQEAYEMWELERAPGGGHASLTFSRGSVGSTRHNDLIRISLWTPAIRETWVQPLGWEDSLEEDMATHSITSWEIDGETVEIVSDFIFLGSKITADGDCSHEIRFSPHIPTLCSHRVLPHPPTPSLPRSLRVA